MNYKVLPLMDEHRVSAAELLRQSWLLHAQHSELLNTERFEEVDEKQWLADFLDKDGHGGFVALTTDHQVVGVLIFEVSACPSYYKFDQQLTIVEVAVAEEHRRKRVAVALEEACENHAKKQGVPLIVGEIYSFNDASRELVKKRGRKLGFETWYKKL